MSAPGPPLYRRAGDLPQRTVETARRDRDAYRAHPPGISLIAPQNA